MNERKKFKEFLCSATGKAVMIIAFYIIIFGIGMTVANFTDVAVVGIILGLVFAIFGWKALNRITPDIFIWMPLAGWLFYFAIKGVLSICIGVFIAPFVIARSIAETIQNNI